MRRRPDEGAVDEVLLDAPAKRVAVLAVGGELVVGLRAEGKGVGSVDAGLAEDLLRGGDGARPLEVRLHVDGAVGARLDDAGDAARP